MHTYIGDALRYLLPFVQINKRDKHSRRIVTFSKVVTLLKVTLIHGCFSSFLNGANGIKSRSVIYWYHLIFFELFKCQPHKMIKHTRRPLAKKLFECV